MMRQAARDSLLYALAAVLYRGITLLQLPLFAGYLKPKDFGLIDITEIVVNLLNLTVALEVSQAVAIYFTESKDHDVKRRIASTSFWFTAACYILFSLLILPLRATIEPLLFDDAQASALLIALLFYALANGVFLLTQNLLRWMLRADRFLLVSLMHGLTSLCTSFILVRWYSAGALGVIYGQILAGVIGSIVALGFSRNFYTLNLHMPTLRTMLRFSTPLVIGSISVLSSLFVDRFCLKALIGLDAVGTYGVAYRFASVVGVIIIGFSRAFTPLVYSQHDQPETPGRISLALNAYLLLSSLIILVLSLFSRELIALLATSIYAEAAGLIPLIAISLVLGNVYVFAPGFAIKKKSKEIAVISLVAAAINFFLNLVLIPIVGLYGAAYATVASSLIAAALWLGLAQKYYPIVFETKKIAVFSCAFMICLITGSLLQNTSVLLKGLAFPPMALLLYTPFRSLFDSMSNSMAKRND
jgi:O-antigen/teichoic acid export membrane protein